MSLSMIKFSYVWVFANFIYWWLLKWKKNSWEDDVWCCLLFHMCRIFGLSIDEYKWDLWSIVRRALQYLRAIFWYWRDVSKGVLQHTHCKRWSDPGTSFGYRPEAVWQYSLQYVQVDQERAIFMRSLSFYDYKARHDYCLVSIKHELFGPWVANLRKRKKDGSLSPQHVQRLDNLGVLASWILKSRARWLSSNHQA